MGAWIEINIYHTIIDILHSRTPRWVRGLKYNQQENRTRHLVSHPTMGAWIEITLLSVPVVVVLVAPHDGCVD